jgi:hypothetical protein
LYDIPPRVLIDGVWRVPPPNMRVRIVMLGNFGHFSGRQESRFISRRGNVITFKELDDDYLEENIIKKTCKVLQINSGETQNIKNVVMQTYHFVNALYPQQHPLTPRNLHMMVMRYAKSHQLFLSIYDEVSGVLDKEGRKKVADWLENTYQINVRQLKKEAKAQTKLDSLKFPVTKKRINPLRILNNFMQLRQLRIDHPELAGQGTVGIYIEGNPGIGGIGKSFFAVEYLRSLGFVDAKNYTPAQAAEKTGSPAKRYYHIQGGTDAEIADILFRALNEHAGVVFDEMNTVKIERVLNAVLSGQTLEGLQISHPEFFLIATGNPKHYAKRHALSDALLNRFQKLDMKDYGPEDLPVIAEFIHGKGRGEELMDYFNAAKAYASYHRKHPAPTPRDLFAKPKA